MQDNMLLLSTCHCRDCPRVLIKCSDHGAQNRSTGWPRNKQLRCDIII